MQHCCSGKAISITYCESVSVTLIIQHAMRMRHIVICGLSSLTDICPNHTSVPETRAQNRQAMQGDKYEKSVMRINNKS